MRVDDVMGKTPSDGDRKAQASEKRPKENAGSDRLEISRGGRRTKRSARELADIKRNIKNSVYTKPSMARAVAERLIGENVFSRRGTDDTAENGEQVRDSSEIRSDRVEDARKKVSHGEYSRDEVLRTIIERIMGKFGIR
jgi:hypothetical protein